MDADLFSLYINKLTFCTFKRGANVIKKLKSKKSKVKSFPLFKYHKISGYQHSGTVQPTPR